MTKVINMFDFKKKEEPKEELSEQAVELFEQAIKRNEENKKRLNAERSKDNKGTLRSYRIKQ